MSPESVHKFTVGLRMIVSLVPSRWSPSSRDPISSFPCKSTITRCFGFVRHDTVGLFCCPTAHPPSCSQDRPEEVTGGEVRQKAEAAARADPFPRAVHESSQSAGGWELAECTLILLHYNLSPFYKNMVFAESSQAGFFFSQRIANSVA